MALNIKRYKEFLIIQEFLYEQKIFAFLFNLLLLIQAEILWRLGKKTASIHKTSWVVRLCPILSLKNIALKRIHAFVENVKTTGRNDLLDEYMNSQEFLNLKKDIDPDKGFDQGALKGNVLVLKEYNETTQEKGVLIFKYTNIFKAVFTINDPEWILDRYYLVLEPSTCGYCDPNILIFVHPDKHVFVQYLEQYDLEFIESLNCNFVPVAVGPNHWVDLDRFYPMPDITKEYDVIYIANWALFKRHYQLFKALKELKQRNIPVKVLLIGFSWSGEMRNITDIKREIKQYDVADYIEILEWVPSEQINLYLNKSKCAILLSKKEGGCKAVTESLAAGIPVILYKYHNGGSVKFINEKTGVLADYHEMPDAIVNTLKDLDQFDPRSWAENNLGSAFATRMLNHVIKTTATTHGEPWSTDIREKTNTPGLQFKN